MRSFQLCLVLLVAISCGSPTLTIDPAEHQAEIESWRAERIERLAQPDGWPSLVALHWLEEGVETFGSALEADLVLPGAEAAIWGRFVVEGDEVRIEAAPESEITFNGEPVNTLVLKSDIDGKPTILRRGPIEFYLIDRAGELAIRAKNLAWLEENGAPEIESFPIDSGYRVDARWVPYEPVKKIPLLNITGQQYEADSPGAIEFELDGKKLRLDALRSPDNMFLIVGDETNGDTTYGAGRYLYAGPVVDGSVVVDFNKLYNPPCVFTEFATCELPPRQNKLPVALTVGEKDYGNH